MDRKEDQFYVSTDEFGWGGGVNWEVKVHGMTDRCGCLRGLWGRVHGEHSSRWDSGRCRRMEEQ